MLAVLLIGGAFLVADTVAERLAERFRVPDVPAQEMPPGPGLCSRVVPMLQRYRHVAEPKTSDTAALLPAGPPLPFSDETAVTVRLNPGVWVSGLGDEAAWMTAFQRFGFVDGVQRFWGDPAVRESTSMQALEFSGARAAARFNRFYLTHRCHQAVEVRWSKAAGGVHMVVPENGDFSQDVTFARGNHFFLAGILRPQPDLDAGAVDRLGRALDRHIRSVARR